MGACRVPCAGARADALGPQAVPVLALRQALHALGLLQQSRDLAHLPPTPPPPGDRRRRRKRLRDDGSAPRRVGAGGVHHHTAGGRHPAAVAEPAWERPRNFAWLKKASSLDLSERRVDSTLAGLASSSVSARPVGGDAGDGNVSAVIVESVERLVVRSRGSWPSPVDNFTCVNKPARSVFV